MSGSFTAFLRSYCNIKFGIEKILRYSRISLKKAIYEYNGFFYFIVVLALVMLSAVAPDSGRMVIVFEGEPWLATSGNVSTALR